MKSSSIPKEVEELLKKRSFLRERKEFHKADEIRQKISLLGYQINDTDFGTEIVLLQNYKAQNKNDQFLVIFGSGELASTGRKIHEQIVKTITTPVQIALLETPAGYEQNPHVWYTKLAEMLKKGLQNYKPEVYSIHAHRRDGEYSTNNKEVIKRLNKADYIHTGAGSPSYAINHLKDSLTLEVLKKQCKKGSSISLASAAAIAMGKYALPVYEIYFAGHDPYWMKGLDFFNEFGLNISILPHFNNTEGGKNIDTRFAYMGKERFDYLLKIHPGPTTIVGLDEHTACVFDVKKKECTVMGKGNVTIIKNGRETLFKKNEKIPYTLLAI